VLELLAKPNRAAAPVAVTAAQMDIKKLPPIAYKPIPLTDAAGKPIPPDAKVTVPTQTGNQTMTAKELFERLNKREKQLNAHGMSLRDAEKKIELGKVKVDIAKLTEQAKAMAAKHVPLSATQAKKDPKKRAELAAAHAAASKDDPKRLEALKGVLPATKRRGGPRLAYAVKEWNYQSGDPGKFSIYLNGKLELEGYQGLTVFKGQGTAGGSILNHRADVVKVTGQVSCPNTGATNAQLNLTVLGKSLFNYNESKNLSWSKQGDFNKTIDQTIVQATFMAGPIPIRVEVAVHATAGFRYFVGLRPVAAQARIVPYANAGIYGKAGVDVVVGGAGVGAQLQLIQDELELGGNARLDPPTSASAKPSFYVHFYGKNSLTALKGRLWVWARIGPNISVFGHKLYKEYEFTIFQYNGITIGSGYIFNEEKRIPI